MTQVRSPLVTSLLACRTQADFRERWLSLTDSQRDVLRRSEDVARHARCLNDAARISA